MIKTKKAGYIEEDFDRLIYIVKVLSVSCGLNNIFRLLAYTKITSVCFPA